MRNNTLLKTPTKLWQKDSSNSQSNLELFKVDLKSQHLIPMFISGIECGFPSPATDYIEQELDLNKYVVKNPSSTFFGRITGYSMEDEGFLPGDLVVIDRSITNYHDKICLCWYNDGFTVKKVQRKGNKLLMIPKSRKFKTIEIVEGNNFNIWGVITFFFKKMD